MTEPTGKKEFKARRKNTADLGAMVYGKVPPQAKDLEEAVLGAIMLEKGAIDLVAEFLKPETFYVEAHKLIFSAMVGLHTKGLPIDCMTVVEHLRESEQLEICGGPYYVTKLTNHVVSSANIVFHSRIILDRFQKRELIRIGGELIQGGYEDSADVKMLLDEHDRSITKLIGSSGDNAVMLDKAMVQSVIQIEELRNKKQDITGVPSGFHDVDKVTHGWQNTDLIILAARPAVGKTAFALNLARNAAMNNIKPVPVAFFSLEMSSPQLVKRIMSSESEIWLDKITNGRMEEDQMKQLYTRAVQPLAKAKIILDDSAALTIFELRAKARRYKKKYDVGLIIVDYLQLMSGDTNDSRNREREISQISRGLKQLAKELNVPLIALSQLSRELEKRKGDNKIPQLSDLRESGAIEQDADMVIFLNRPEYYDVSQNEMGESIQGLTMVDIAKHRNGTLAHGKDAIQLRANLAIQKFFDVEKDFAAGIKELGAGAWRPVQTIEKDELLFEK